MREGHRTYLFVRHAEATHQSPAFEPGAYAGDDAPLTARGVEQARAAAMALASRGIERVVSSALTRACQTAEHVGLASGAPYEHVWPELDELAPRLLRRDARVRPEWWDGILGAWHAQRYARGARGGPFDIAPVELRICEVLARLDALEEERIAVVGHGYWILLMALVVPGPMRLRAIRNCSVTEIECRARGQHRLLGFARVLSP